MSTLKELRIETGLKPAAFAAEAGVGYQTYYRWENGRKGISIEAKSKILKALSRLLERPITLKDIEGVKE